MNTIKPYLVLLLIVSFSKLQAQYSCGSAVAITDGYTSGWISTPGTGGIQDWVSSASSCGSASASSFTSKDVYMFKYTTGAAAGESMYFTIQQDYATDYEHSIGVWTGCSGSTLSGCVTSTYKYYDVVGVCVQNMAANTTYYIGVGKEYFGNSYLKFKVIDFTVELSTTTPADECAGASPINVTMPYSGSTRCNYTASAGSPTSCGTIENDAWMKFVAGSSSVVINYQVTNCTYNYGVQLSVFKGACGSNTLITGSCINYASNNSTGTWSFSGLTVGNTYYIRADGYAGDLCSYAFTPVSGVVLPIELEDFTVQSFSNQHRQLHWQTASEYNNDFFEIQKSDDGIHFYSIGKLKGSGSSTLKKEYQLDDYTGNSSPVTYYRLKQVDYDENFDYSKIISIANESNDDIELYPNPNETGVFLFRGKNTERLAAIIITDLIGHQIYQSTLSPENSVYDFSFLSNGVYSIQLIKPDMVITKKIVIQKK